MAFFPLLPPSSRTFTPSVFPQAMLRTMGGLQSQVRHSNALVGGTVRLTYNAITPEQLQQFRSHFLSCAGLYATFAPPAEVWSGTIDPTPEGYSWKYQSRIAITDVGCGYHNVAITLEMMPGDPMVIAVLPEPEPEPPVSENEIIVYATASELIALGDFDSFEDQSQDFGREPFVPDGGPFDEPYIENSQFDNNYRINPIGDRLNPGTDDYTLELWVRWNGQTALTVLMFDNVSFDEIRIDITDTQIFGEILEFDTFTFTNVSATAATTDWLHIALSRQNGIQRFYAGGSQVGSDLSVNIPFSPDTWIATRADADMGQMRYTKGEALYTGATYTVPTQPFFVP